MKFASFFFVGLLMTSYSANAEEVDPLAELSALGNALAEKSPEGGGSIRAKKDVDPGKAQRQKDTKNLEAKVEEIKVGNFPNVALRLKVIRGASEGPGKGHAANATLVVVPKLKVEKGQVIYSDLATVTNAGAYYLMQGDKVVVRLGAQKDKIWEAEYVERK